MQFIFSLDEDDLVIWFLIVLGKFFFVLVWNMFRQKKEVFFLDLKIWYRDVFFKMVFFIWRVVYDKFLIDERVFRFGYFFFFKCYCCVDFIVNLSLEFVEYFFCFGVFV